jgi:hypothetical protein
MDPWIQCTFKNQYPGSSGMAFPGEEPNVGIAVLFMDFLYQSFPIFEYNCYLYVCS